MTIGDRLREERERLGLSQPKLAAVAGTTKQTLFSWETGKTAPDGFQLAAMAERGADVRYIVTGDRDYVPPPPLTAEEATMLDYFRQAEPAVRRAAIGALVGAGGVSGLNQATGDVHIGEMQNNTPGGVQIGVQAGGKVKVVRRG